MIDEAQAPARALASSAWASRQWRQQISPGNLSGATVLAQQFWHFQNEAASCFTGSPPVDRLPWSP